VKIAKNSASEPDRIESLPVSVRAKRQPTPEQKPETARQCNSPHASEKSQTLTNAERVGEEPNARHQARAAKRRVNKTNSHVDINSLKKQRMLTILGRYLH
jgi:hypothetical protein